MGTPENSTDLKLDRLIAKMEALLKPPAKVPPVPDKPPAPRPQKTIWYAVRWSPDSGKFDMATLRREPMPPGCHNDPRLQRSPFVFPWIYLRQKPPEKLQRELVVKKMPSYMPSDEMLVRATIDWLNKQCSWQTPAESIAKILHACGAGWCLRHVQGGYVPEHIPPLRFRKKLGGKPKNAPRASQRPHTGLREAIRRERLKRDWDGHVIYDPHMDELPPHKMTQTYQPVLTPLPPEPNRHPTYQMTLEDLHRYCQAHGLSEADETELRDLLAL